MNQNSSSMCTPTQAQRPIKGENNMSSSSISHNRKADEVGESLAAQCASVDVRGATNIPQQESIPVDVKPSSQIKKSKSTLKRSTKSITNLNLATSSTEDRLQTSASSSSLVSKGSSSTSGTGNNANAGSNVSYGRWTREEHAAFLEGLKYHGREWKKVSEMISTRTSAQIRSHAQKYFAKLAKEGGSSASAVHNSSMMSAEAEGINFNSATFNKKIEMIMKDPDKVGTEVSTRLDELRKLHERLAMKLEQTKKQKMQAKKRQGDDVSTLLQEAEAEMKQSSNPNRNEEIFRKSLAASNSNGSIGPATAALLATQQQEQASRNAKNFASSTNSTKAMAVQNMHQTISHQSQPKKKQKIKPSISHHEMIALEVLGTGALSTNTYQSPNTSNSHRQA